MPRSSLNSCNENATQIFRRARNRSGRTGEKAFDFENAARDILIFDIDVRVQISPIHTRCLSDLQAGRRAARAWWAIPPSWNGGLALLAGHPARAFAELLSNAD